jgi:hypothetical protein
MFADMGPLFYINMDKNLNQEDVNAACFGKIVQGKGILDIIAVQDRKQPKETFTVDIRSVRVLPPQDDKGSFEQTDARSLLTSPP